jgi:hypothetical protein
MTRTSRRRPLWRRLFRYTAVTFAVFALVYIFGGMWVIHSACVQLPNGLLLGDEAYVDPDRNYWMPNVVLKYPDGATVQSGWVESFHFSETTVWGRTASGSLNGLGGESREHPAYDDAVSFAYRPDVGLVYSHEDPAAYRRLRVEAGPIVWNDDDTNLLGTYLELREDPEFSRSFCPLSLLPDRRTR